MKKVIFTGSGVAIVTPMKPDGSIDFEMIKRLIEFHLENGTDAIISCGTTGESATLNHEEHCKVLEYTINVVNGRVPVIAGAGSNDTAYAAELSAEAKKLGADALLSVTPYYNKTSQVGLVQHYRYIADRADLPMILYNVPSRTGCNIKPETYLELSKIPSIVAIKEANGDLSAIARTAALCGDEMAIYSGNDDQTLPILSLGGKGIISVFANICPKQMHDICRLFFEGKLEASRAMCLEYLDLMNALFTDVNPIPVKEAMRMIGFECGECRLPLAPMNDAAKASLRAVLKKHALV
jgi:4-hydroxy-tetrahydrodipicolinate synthase